MEGGARSVTSGTVRYAVVDVEGNGQQPPDLVELAVVPVVGGVIGRPACWLVKPTGPISSMATRIHGLPTRTSLTRQPSQTSRPKYAGTGCRRLGGPQRARRYQCPVPPSGGWQCPEVFDTLRLARRLVPGQETYKLGALVATFALAEGLPAGLTPHRATYDALVTARLFVHLATRQDTGPLSLGELRGNKSGGDRDAPSLF